MNVTNIIEQCLAHDISLRVDGEQLRVHTDEETIDPALLDILREHKADLISTLQRKDSAKSLENIPRLKQRSGTRASFSQHRMWFIDHLEGSSTQYNLPTSLRCQGHINLDSFHETIRLILQRHEVLRTRYRMGEDYLYQIIDENFDLPVQHIELTQYSGQNQFNELCKLAKNDLHLPFDLETDVMIRVTLVKLADDDHVVLFNVHHIAADGWSIGLLVQEFNLLYNACVTRQIEPLAPLPIQYADYAQWQRNRFQ